MTRVVSLGLDGAAWHKLDRLINEGKMPNLEAIVENGARADLQTINPPVTCPAWRCSTSGKNPGKLGVFWWLNLDHDTGEITSPDATSFDTADIWNYLSEAGKRCAVINVPMTYPTSSLNGTMVSGFGAPFDIDEDANMGSITSPQGFQTELENQYDWKIGIDDITTESGLEETYDLIKSRFELLLDLLEDDFDYLHATIFYINMLQHKYGDGPETAMGWKLIDEYLGKLRAADDCLLVIYSDHGHSTIENTFVVNRWLLNNGYLTLESRNSDRLGQALYSGVNRLGISPKNLARWARDFLPASLFHQLVESGSPISTAELADRIVWNETDAVAMSQGPLYINREKLGDDYESVRTELKSELRSLTYRGESVLSTVHKPTEIYSGPHLSEAPDLMLVSNEGWELYGGVIPSVFDTQVTSWTSGNHPIGVLAMEGPGVSNKKLSTRSILDVAPTVLAYLDCAIPTDMDGEPLDAAFDTPLSVDFRDPLPSQQYRGGVTDDEIEDRLADLGYLE